MFSNLITWFQTSDWYSIADYVVVGLLARYIPAATPIWTSFSSWLRKLLAK